MTTALDLVSRAARMLGVLAKGESLDDSDAQDGLTALNALLGTMSNGSGIYVDTLDTITLTAGVASITVGPSGTTATTRPMRVLDSSYLTNGNVTYGLRIFTEQQYSDVMVKSTPGIPEAVWPQMSMPDVQLTFWPVPAAGYTLNLWSTKALTAFPALTTTVSLPPGYEDLLALELAEALAPEYEVEVPPAVMRRLQRVRRAVALTNLEVPILKTRHDERSGRYNVLTNQ